MSMRSRVLVGASAVMLVALAGCSTKADTEGGATSGDLKVDVGVDDAAITLGVMTDISGVFKSNGLAATAGNQIWADEVNAAGGICEREIILDVKDHGYEADNAVPLYEQTKSSVLGYVQLIGTPMLSALKTRMADEQVLAATPTTGSNALDTDSILPVAATYDIEMINGLAYLMEQGLISEGGKIGHIYLNSEPGENASAGAKHYADQHGIEILESPISASDTDMTATVTKMVNEGVEAILVMSAPATLASVGLQVAGQNPGLPILGSSPTYATSLLANPGVVEALRDNYYVSTPIAPYGAIGVPAAEMVQEEYQELHPDEVPNPIVNLGYLSGLAWGGILERACENGDLTRAGVLKARDEVTALDAQGLTGELDLSDPGASPSNETFIEKLNPEVEGGLEIEEDLFGATELADYRTPFQKD